jgi:L-ascorbate metabolism protein UlaG (beta-lactamase superfamily)
MGVKDAVTAAGWLGCNEILGIHYDTFPPIAIDHAEARAAFAKAGKNLHLMEIGAEREF